MMAALNAISERKPQGQLAGGCLVFLGSIFLLLGGGMFFFAMVWPTIQVIRAQSWPDYPAEIVVSRVHESADSDGSTYRPEVHFKYAFDGQEFVSEYWSFSKWSTSENYAKQIVSRYPPGSKQTCFYNPDNPSLAVLDRSFGAVWHWGSLFLLIFVAIGTAILFSGISEIRKNQIQRRAELLEQEQNRNPTAVIDGTNSQMDARYSHATIAQSDVDSYSTSEITEAADSADDLESEQEPTPWQGFEGPRRLEPATPRWLAFLIIAAAAGFWNAISWTMWLSLFGDDGIWSFGVLLAGLFPLIGIGLAAIALYQFLGLFNPKVTIAISNGAVMPGETVDIAWELTGRHQWVKRLKIDWVGQESVTYTRGTDTTTEKKEFLRIPISHTSEAEQIRFSSTSLTLPKSMIHSFAAPHNRIEWTIEVQGTVNFWPDVRDSIVVYVRPQTGEAES